MAFLLPNLSPPLHLQPTKSSKEKQTFIYHNHTALFSSSSSSSSSSQNNHTQIGTSLIALSAPVLQDAQVETFPGAQDKHHHEKDELYANLGLALRTLREDMPLLFTRDLNYHIYRDDITFVDPLNKFTGIDNYKLIFWALRFHGRILFQDISLEVYRIWQPSENVILIRWNLMGVPRVPWEAKGEFHGTSWFKLDRNGKIYEHKVDNLAFNFPQQLKPATSVLNLVAASSPASPNPTFLWGSVEDLYSSSWVQFYRAVRETLDNRRQMLVHDGLATCS